MLEGFIKGEDYDVCVQNKQKNYLWILPENNWKAVINNCEFPMTSIMKLLRNFLKKPYSWKSTVLVGDHKSQDCDTIDASVGSSNQATKNIGKGRNKD